MKDQMMIDEVWQILKDAAGALSVGQVLDKADLVGGRDAAASALQHLVDAGHARQTSGFNGARLYTAVIGATPATAAVDAVAPRPQHAAEPKRRAIRDGLTDKVRAALREAGGPVTSAQLAAILSEDTQRVRCTLSDLQRRQEIESLVLPGSKVKSWQPCQPPEATTDTPAPAQSQRQEAPAPKAEADDAARHEDREPAGSRRRPGEASTAFRFCVWDDGHIEIYRGIELTETLTLDEVQGLLAFLDGVSQHTGDRPHE
ncbi:MAG: hypothetical protein WED00_05830 [Aquisalimonadaceae bacterium]